MLEYNMQTPEYKIVVIGETDIGKSTFIKRLVYNLERLYTTEKTLGVDVMCLDLHGNNGRIRLNMWDCGGKYRGLGEKYYIDAYGAIIFKNGSNNNHLAFEYGLPETSKKFYIDDFNMGNPEHTVAEYKNQLYKWIFS